MKQLHTIKSIPLYVFSLLLISTLLAACGGGGGSSFSSGQEYDFDNYVGNEKAAQITANNPAVFIDILFSKIGKTLSASPNSDIANPATMTTQSAVDTQASQIQVDESEACVNNGRIVFSGELSEQGTGIIVVDYQNCEIDGLIYDGRGALEINVVDLNTGFFIQDAATVYEKVIVSDASSSFRISGTVHYNQSKQSCSPEIYTANLVLIDTAGSNHYKLSDLTISNHYCFDAPGEEITGRIYNAIHGYIDISTETGLLYSNSSAIYPDREGRLVLSGANNSKAILSVTEHTVYKNYNYQQQYLNKLSIDVDGDNTYEFEATMPIESFNRGAWKDLADNDSDGIPNSWESSYGLDASDSSDAVIDSDADGYSNLIEYQRHGDPSDASILPDASDLSVSIEQPADVRAGHEMFIRITVDNPNTVYGARDIDITLTKSSNADWSETSLCQVDATNADQLHCRIDYIDQSSFGAFQVGLTADNPDNVTLTGTVTAATLDPVASNNHDSTTGTFTQRLSNIGLAVDSVYNHHDVAVIGRSHSFDLLITQWGPDDARDAVFSMDIPANVQIEAADYVIYPGINSFPGASGPCIINIQIICNIGTIQHNPGSYKGEIKIRMSGLTEGISSYNATITSSSTENEPNDNAFTQRVFVGNSLQSFQQQVNNSSATTTISIPAGYFVGSIDYQDKPIRIESSAGAGQTMIWTDSPFTATDISYPYFNIGNNGELSGLTFLGKFRAARIVGTNVIIENNIFEFNNIETHENPITQTIILEALESQITIRNNIFRHYRHSSLCAIMYFYGTTSFNIENNLFHDNNNCNTIYVNDDVIFASNNVSQIISNNTFVNTANVIHLKMQNVDSVVKVQNNIFAGNANVIDAYLPSIIIGTTTLQPPIISNNMFYNNSSNIRFIDSLIDLPYTGPVGDIPLVSNISTDPLFADPINNNYRLQITSDGVDAGEENDAPLFDLDGTTRPLDGDLDGISIIDIGAYEYTPQ
jgi:archaellin